MLLTLGSRGAMLITDAAATSIPPIEVSALDATAAGDAFNGALAVALAEGKPLEAAARFATIAAGIAVTRLGAQPSLATRAELDAYGG